MIKLKATNLEFEAAAEGGCVFGELLNRRPKLYVYAGLGPEVDYQLRDKDDSNTKYRKVVKCEVNYALTEEDCDNSRWYKMPETMSHNVIVVIYC